MCMCVYQYVRMHNRWRFVVADVFIIKWTLAPVALHAMHCHWVCLCVCAKSDICVWINLKLIESFCLDTLLILCFYVLFAALLGHRKYATRAKVNRARVRTKGGGTALLLTVAIEHRIRIENGAESRETGGRKFKIFFWIQLEQQQQQQQQRAHHVNVKRLQREPTNNEPNMFEHVFNSGANERTYVVLERFLLIF